MQTKVTKEVLVWRGGDRGPGPGELEVLEEHPRQL